MKPVYIPSTQQLANVLTKPLSTPLFFLMVVKLNIGDHNAQPGRGVFKYDEGTVNQVEDMNDATVVELDLDRAEVGTLAQLVKCHIKNYMRVRKWRGQGPPRH